MPKPGYVHLPLDLVAMYIELRKLHHEFARKPARMARYAPSPTWKGLGLGVSKAQTGFKPLPAVPSELRGIDAEVLSLA
jgi:hypothetical protein